MAINSLQNDRNNEKDMSTDILQQMSGEITREEVEERIKFYQTTNTK